jgi:acetyltransferase-like isoleucine patch superfamily enzyme
MNNIFIAFFNNKYLKIFGCIVKFILRFKGIKIGKNFKCENFPKIILSKNSEFFIGNNVTFVGNVEIRAYRNSKIFFLDNTKFDDGTRLISAENSFIEIGHNTVIGKNTVVNAGAKIKVGMNVLISGNVYLQSSSHGTKLGKNINEQEHLKTPINISNDVWIGAHSTILPGVNIDEGAIVGANTLINENIPRFEIWGGVPGKKISMRK